MVKLIISCLVILSFVSCEKPELLPESEFSRYTRSVDQNAGKIVFVGHYKSTLSYPYYSSLISSVNFSDTLCIVEYDAGTFSEKAVLNIEMLDGSYSNNPADSLVHLTEIVSFKLDHGKLLKPLKVKLYYTPFKRLPWNSGNTDKIIIKDPHYTWENDAYLYSAGIKFALKTYDDNEVKEYWKRISHEQPFIKPHFDFVTTSLDSAYVISHLLKNAKMQYSGSISNTTLGNQSFTNNKTYRTNGLYYSEKLSMHRFFIEDFCFPSSRGFCVDARFRYSTPGTYGINDLEIKFHFENTLTPFYDPNFETYNPPYYATPNVKLTLNNSTVPGQVQTGLISGTFKRQDTNDSIKLNLNFQITRTQ